MMHPLVNHADHEEHASRADAVGQHLEHRAVHSHLPIADVEVVAGHCAPHADAQQDVTHVAHRAVGHQPLEILLGQRRERPIHHAQNAQAANQQGQVISRVRADRVTDANDAVPAQFQEHAGQDHRDRRGGLDVRVGQPSVNRHRRHLDDEADEQQQKRPPLQAFAQQQIPLELRGVLAQFRSGPGC